jgi:hypothetical protein
MLVRLWLRTLVMVPFVVGGLLVHMATGQEGLPANDAIDGGPGPAKPDRSFVDGIAKDLGFTLLANPGQTGLRLPLAPGDWSFLKGVRPYAAVSPSTVKPITGDEPGLAVPFREVAEDPWKGLGLGAGFQWHLSDRLDLFGQYQFKPLPGGNAPTGSPFMQREIENPGVKAGLSIHF